MTVLTLEPTSTLSTDHKDILPNVKKLVLEYSIIEGSGFDRLFTWIPALESLAIYGSSTSHVFDFTRTLRDSCPFADSPEHPKHKRQQEHDLSL
ncbi:hypothetical protein KI688_012920 [Linnemannia hyalina]|uniref:Uncharacterized protein n=1 Tax=Linnemannia hyalina TaxID=64524 RepID=A0A9P7XUS8_9FUNG|nr:hypothetical protein KI688_012920 [Linnemannia hyalina]